MQSIYRVTIECLNKYIDSVIFSKFYWTNTLGILRSVLALSTMLTLLTTDSNGLFYYGINGEYGVNCHNNTFISLYCIVGPNLWISKIISICVLVIIIVGVYPKYTCIMHWWITYSFASSAYFVDGGDQIASIITLLLIPILLFDKRKNHFQIQNFVVSDKAKIISFVCMTLLQIQIAIIYFHSGVAKLSVNEWVDGTAIYYWFTEPHFGMRSSLTFLFRPIWENPFLLTIVTWGVIFFEILLFSALFMRHNLKNNFLVLGILFHFLIFIIHGLFSFFLVMICCLFLFLYPIETTMKLKV